MRDIEITVIQFREPHYQVLKDSRGSDLLEGATVCYNLSGAVRIGVLKKIVKNTWKKGRVTGN